MALGLEADFAFCATYPSGAPPGYDLVFHNPLLDPAQPVLHWVRIVRIRHPSLGEVRRVDTKGLVYALELIDGAVIQVEAEETPGRIEYMPPTCRAEVEGWDLEVEVDRSRQQ